MAATTDSDGIYHERQRKHLCALHVLNNLLQAPVFTQSDLDDICTSLTPKNYFNPHRSVLGLGNYDVNVIASALQTRDLCVVWFDKRKDVQSIDLSQVKGVILNVPTGFLKLPIDFNFKHWVVYREIRNVYYNLDSKISKPEEIGTRQQMLEYLSEKLGHKKTELLLVVTPQVDQDGLCYHDASASNVKT